MKINIENLIEVPGKNPHKCTGCVFNFAGNDCNLYEILPCADNGTIFVEKPPKKEIEGIENLVKVPELREGSCAGCEFEDGEGCLADVNQVDANCGDTKTILISKNKVEEYNILVAMLNENSMLNRLVEEKIAEVIQ